MTTTIIITLEKRVDGHLICGASTTIDPDMPGEGLRAAEWFVTELTKMGRP